MLAQRMMLEELHLKHLTMITVGKTNRSGVKIGHQKITFVDGVEVQQTDCGDMGLGGGSGDGEKWDDLKYVFQWNNRTQ